MENRRTLEIFLMAGFIGIAGPCAVLLGADHGRKMAAIAFPAQAAALKPAMIAAWRPEGKP